MVKQILITLTVFLASALVTQAVGVFYYSQPQEALIIDSSLKVDGDITANISEVNSLIGQDLNLSSDLGLTLIAENFGLNTNANSRALTVTGDGAVSLGQSPLAASGLQVNNKVRASNSSTNLSRFAEIAHNGTSAIIGGAGAGELIFRNSANTNLLRIDSSGNVRVNGGLALDSDGTPQQAMSQTDVINNYYNSAPQITWNDVNCDGDQSCTSWKDGNDGVRPRLALDGTFSARDNTPSPVAERQIVMRPSSTHFCGYTRMIFHNIHDNNNTAYCKIYDKDGDGNLWLEAIGGGADQLTFCEAACYRFAPD